MSCPPVAPSSTTTRTVFGGSIAKGWYSSYYPCSYAVLCGANYTLGYPGKRTGEFTSLIPGIPGDTKTLVLGPMGTNDWWANVPLATFQSDFTTFWNTLKTKFPTASFVIVGAWGPATGTNGGGAAIADYNNAMATVSGQAVLNVSDIYDNSAYHVAQGASTEWGGAASSFHPNDQGHALIAQRVQASPTFK